MMSVYRRSLLLLALTACSHTKAGTVVFGAAGPWNEAYGDANKKAFSSPSTRSTPVPRGRATDVCRYQFADDSGKGARASAVAQ